MKFSHLLIIALFGSFVAVVSCNDKKEDPASQTTTVTPDMNTTAQDPTLVASTPAAGGSNEFHFKCPKNCEGGGAANKGNCPICGTELVHNQAFHNQAPAADGSSPQTPIQIDPKNAAPSTVSSTPSTKTMTPEPPQNEKGVWHWTCSKGCEGGGGGAGNCAKCGNALTHNTAYHQK